jgi:hypothetical protein
MREGGGGCQVNPNLPKSATVHFLKEEHIIIYCEEFLS